MKNYLLLLLVYVLAFLPAAGGAPFCRVVNYDENDGLSQHLVKQIVEDDDGMLWFATWNGINRFDGYEFAPVRPGVDDAVRRYSNRFRDIKLSSKGNIWCRIDNKIVLLDKETNRFSDVHSRLEEKFGRSLAVSRWSQAENGDLILECGDGCFILLPGENVDGAELSARRPELKLRSFSNRKVGQVGDYPYSELTYSRRDPDGTVWGVTRRGLVVCDAGGTGKAEILADLDADDGSMKYCTTDSEGNLWMCSSKGAHCISLGYLPYENVEEAAGMRVLSIGTDTQGRIWIADGTDKAVAIFSPDLRLEGYLGKDGRISREKVSFGHSVYSIKSSPDGTMWLGTKPDGLFRLRPEDDGAYNVSHIADGNVYDTLLDADGRLWVATLGGGVMRIDNPFDSAPAVSSLASIEGYPSEAMSCRRIISQGDSLMLVATTGGLLSFSTADKPDFSLSVTRPGEAGSLGCIAVMDLLLDTDGNLLVATESDAVNLRTVDDGGQWYFHNPPMLPSVPSEVALSLTPLGEGGGLLVVSNNLVYKLEPSGTVRTFGSAYWQRELRFRECRPLRLADGRWLFGLEDGAYVAPLDRPDGRDRRSRLAFTSVSVQNRPDSLLSASTDRLVLGKNQRNVSLRFSALAHSGLEEITYEFRVRDGEWTRLGTDRSITFLDLEPGTFTVDVRAVDASGRRPESVRRLTLVVEPKFHETLLAKILFALIILAVIGLGLRLYIYIRAIKRKQSETLEAYMNLLSRINPVVSTDAADTAPASGSESGQATEDAVATAAEARITPSDRQFMDRIVDYVNTHLSDLEAGVDGMAEAAAVSRSGLTRKMRSLTGVSPADFLKQARLSHAEAMLTTTDLPVKEIAFDCGFSDLNYFGKCFKSAYGLSPTAYRKEKTD